MVRLVCASEGTLAHTRAICKTPEKNKYSDDTYSVFTLSDTKTDKKWNVWNCVEVFTMKRNRHQQRFPLGFTFKFAFASMNVA